MIAVLKVHAVDDRVPEMPAPVACLVSFEVGPAVLREALFGAERLFVVRFGGRGTERERFGHQRFVAPSTRGLLHRRVWTNKNRRRINAIPKGM